jgi:hypothetical protein
VLARMILGMFAVAVWMSPSVGRAQGHIQFNQPALSISGFPFVISVPGSYIMTGNLAAPSPLHGIHVTVDNVTIDLNGFVLSGGGGGSTGIIASGKGLTVRNGTIEGFGIAISAPSDCKLTDLKISDNGQGVTGAQRCLIAGNRIVDSSVGFAIEALDSRIEDNVIENNAGAGIMSSAGSAIIRNRIANNAQGGIVDNGGAKIEDNVISGNGQFGIRDGLAVTVPPTAPPFPTGLRTSIIGNTIDHTSGPGIEIGLPALISDNTVSTSNGSGIVCGAACVVRDNTVDRNNLNNVPGGGGVSVADGSNVHGNAISYNQGFGLTLPPAGNASYTNNTITGNGTPLGTGPNVISPPTLTGGAGNNCGGVACP